MKHSLLSLLLILVLASAATSQTRSEQVPTAPRQDFVSRTFEWGVELLSSDTTKHPRYSYFITPIFAYSPETEFIFGVSPLFIIYPQDKTSRPSNVDFNFDITTLGQILVNLEYNTFSVSEKYYLRGVTSYQNYILNYYGTGQEASLDDEEVFGYQSILNDAVIQRRIAKNWYAGTGYKYEAMQRMSQETDGLLETNRPLGWNGSVVSGPIFGFIHDSRDNILTASKGWYASYSLDVQNQIFGSQFNFTRHRLDLRNYQTLRKKHNQILASQFIATSVNGEVPFKDLALLGGSRMLRGYYQGRFRDNHMYSAQTEYRRDMLPWLGMVAFAAAGDIANQVDQFRFNQVKYAGGLGLRFKVLPKENVNARFDAAMNNEGNLNFYLWIAEAF